MTQRGFVGILTVVVFAAGYGTRALTDREKPVPAPPPELVREMQGASNAANHKSGDPSERAKLVGEIQKLKPQIDAYSAHVQEIYAEYDREFALLLTPAQRVKFEINQKKRAEAYTRRITDRRVLSDEELIRERDRPLTDIYRMVTVTQSLEWMTKEYGLDTAQQAATRQLLSIRRNKFVALFDATPHPSIRLSRLAPMLERVQATSGESPKK